MCVDHPDPQPHAHTTQKLTAALSLLVWNAPYACLYFMRAQGRPSFFDRCGEIRLCWCVSTGTKDKTPTQQTIPGSTHPPLQKSYLIQPPSSKAKGQPGSWRDYAEAASTMNTQLLFLGAVLAWGGGSRAILYYRCVSVWTGRRVSQSLQPFRYTSDTHPPTRARKQPRLAGGAGGVLGCQPRIQGGIGSSGGGGAGCRLLVPDAEGADPVPGTNQMHTEMRGCIIMHGLTYPPSSYNTHTHAHAYAWAGD